MTLNPSLQAAIILIGRLMLAAIFIQAGYGKIFSYEGSAAYMQAAGVPGQLLPLVIAAELGGGILIALGWFTRLVAFLLAGFTLVAAYFFHLKVGDRGQMINFMKNIAIAGGFLQLVANGAGAWSIDGRGRS
jgi:putative oxidoreductase